MDVKYALKGQNKQYYSGLMPLSRSERLLKSSTMVNNIIDRMQTRKRLYELVEYEKYNSLDEKIYNFSTEGHE